MFNLTYSEWNNRSLKVLIYCSLYKTHREAEKCVGDHNVLSVDYFSNHILSTGHHYLQVMVIYILSINHIQLLSRWMTRVSLFINPNDSLQESIFILLKEIYCNWPSSHTQDCVRNHIMNIKHISTKYVLIIILTIDVSRR